MANINRYLPNGYIDIKSIRACGCPFIYLISPRRSGKTFGCFMDYIENDQKFLYLRRTRNAIDTCSTKQGNPFKDINKKLKTNIEPFKRDQSLFFSTTKVDSEGKVEEDKEIAMGLSLSDVGKSRGMSFSDYDYILFDEIVPQPNENNRYGEAEAFISLYDTINSNRELEGKDPVQVLFLGNSDKLECNMLSMMGTNIIIERLLREGKYQYVNKESGVAVFLFDDSKVAKQRLSECILYKALRGYNDEYIDMATKNVFNDLLWSNMSIASMPIQEYNCIFSLNNEIYVWQHKSNGTYYVCEHKAGKIKNYNLSPEDKRLFRTQNMHLVESYFNYNVKFQTYKCLLLFKKFIFNR